MISPPHSGSIVSKDVFFVVLVKYQHLSFSFLIGTPLVHCACCLLCTGREHRALGSAASFVGVLR